MDGAREYLDALGPRIRHLEPGEVPHILNELYRICSELCSRLEVLEDSDRIVFVPEFLDS